MRHLSAAIMAVVFAILTAIGVARVQTGGPTIEARSPEAQLRPEVYNQQLQVSGSGFQANERIVLTIEIPGIPDGSPFSNLPVSSRKLNVTADGQGYFSLETGITVQEVEGGSRQYPYGASVRVRAEGDKGTEQTVIYGWTPSAAPGARPSTSTETDFSLSNGWFYTQASGQPGRGFAVTDDTSVRFWSEFQRLGGVEGVGYPISRRFVWDGFASQVFQKMVFQWHPEQGRVYAVNVIDLLHDRGLDGWLRTHRATPPIADWSSDTGKPWDEVIAAHLALLTEPDIQAAYYAVDDPITLYGLPMAPIQDMGNVLVLRAQRGTIQKWLVDTPWAQAGQVTIANSGDLAKEAVLVPGTALEPEKPQ